MASNLKFDFNRNGWTRKDWNNWTEYYYGLPDCGCGLYWDDSDYGRGYVATIIVGDHIDWTNVYNSATEAAISAERMLDKMRVLID